MTEDLHTMPFERLLMMAIKRNARACHEIETRQLRIVPIPPLSRFIFDELAKVYSRHPDDDDGDRGWIHPLAKRCIAAGYYGQNMRDSDNARDYIEMAAANPLVEEELPEAGFAFWKSVKFNFERWKVRQART